MNILQKAVIGVSVLASTTFYGCTDNVSYVNNISSDAISSTYEQKLKNANEVLIDETVFCFGKEYTIYADTKKVATLKGKNVNWWEDRFVLTTLDGKVIESENENKRILTLNRSASFYDGDGKINGYIAEHKWDDLLKLDHIFHVYDVNQNEIGKTKNKAFTFLDRIEIYNTQGKLAYIAKEKFSVFNDKYILTVTDSSSVISIEKAIMLVCIEDAISDAKSSSSDDDSSSSSSDSSN